MKRRRFAGLAAPSALALEFCEDAIALKTLSDGAWREVGRVSIHAPTFAEEILSLLKAAEDISASKRPEVDIWLPKSEVRNLAAAGGGADHHEALAAQTDAEAGDLVIDATDAGDVVSAVDRTVVDEALKYASDWGFAARRVTTRHGPEEFPHGPTFHEAAPRRSPPRPAFFAASAAAASAFMFVVAAWLGDMVPLQDAASRNDDAVAASAPVPDAPLADPGPAPRIGALPSIAPLDEAEGADPRIDSGSMAPPVARDFAVSPLETPPALIPVPTEAGAAPEADLPRNAPRSPTAAPCRRT